MSDSDRNPLLIPGRTPVSAYRCCPKCKSQQYSGRNLGGVVKYTCSSCRNTWHGGIGQVAEDTSIPKPPMNPADKPLVEFAEHPRTGKVEEIVRRPNPTQEFRKGLPIPNGEE